MHPHFTRQGDFNQTASNLADSALEDIRKRSLQGLDVLERYDMLLSEIHEAFHDHKRSLHPRGMCRPRPLTPSLSPLLVKVETESPSSALPLPP